MKYHVDHILMINIVLTLIYFGIANPHKKLFEKEFLFYNLTFVVFAEFSQVGNDRTLGFSMSISQN